MATTAKSSVVINMKSAQRALSFAEQRVSMGAISGHLGTVIQPYLSRRAKMRFQKGIDADGAKWTPLTDATNEIRKSLGFRPIKPVNVRTGHMRDTIVNAKADLTATPEFNLLKYPGNNIMDRPDMFHRVQQSIGNRKGPARPVVGIGAEDIAFVLASMRKFVVGGIEIGGKR